MKPTFPDRIQHEKVNKAKTLDLGIHRRSLRKRKINEKSISITTVKSAALPFKELIENEDQQCIVAMETEDSEQLVEVMASTSYPHSQNPNNETTLMHAAAGGHIAVLRTLLHHSTNINQRDKSKNSALMKAAESGQKDCVEFLLAAGAYIAYRNNSGETALTLACQYGTLSCVDSLVNAGANIDYTSRQGHSILYYAVSSGNLDIVKYVFECKCNVASRMKNIVSSLFTAIEKKAVHIVKYLIHFLDVCDLNIKSKSNALPLECAVAADQLDIALCLLNVGADVNVASKGQTLFMRACQIGSQAMCKILIPHCSDLNQKDRKGQTALLISIHGGRPEIVELLLQSGAYVDLQDNMGRTALLCACKDGNVEIVRMLTSARCNLNHRDKDQKDSALMWCCRNDQPNLIKLLVNAGAELELTDKHENTALSVAAEFDNAEAIRLLLEYGSYIDHANCFGNTPLMISASGGCEETLAILLKSSPDINYQNKRLKTALMLACKNGHLQSFRIILNAGANVHLLNGSGQNVLEEIMEKCHKFMLQFWFRQAEMLKSAVRKGAYLGRAMHMIILQNNRRTCKIQDALQCEIYPSLETTKGLYIPDNTLHSDTRLTPLVAALLTGKTELARYFVSTLFLHWSDVSVLPHTPLDAYFERPVQGPAASLPSHQYKRQLFSQPWTLTSLSFIKVSTLLGFGPDRPSQVTKLMLPTLLQNKLLFQNNLAKFPPEEWKNLNFEYVHSESL